MAANEECPPTAFGEQVVGDHFLNRRKDNFVLGLEDEDSVYPGAKTAVVFYDRGTGAKGCYPKATKSAEHTIEACSEFAGTQSVKSIGN